MLKFLHQSLKLLLKYLKENPKKLTSKNIRAYNTGKFFLWMYSNHKNKLPTFLREQFEYRLKVVNKECATEGQCKHCGCDLPDLLFAFKQCEGKEYPRIMNPYKWRRYKRI